GINESFLLEIADEQRADAPPIGGRERKAADDQLFTSQAFDFDPVAAATRTIGPVATLGDDAFQAELARLAQECLARLVDVIAELDDGRLFLPQKLAQSLLPLGQRQTPQIIAVLVEQIERI